MCHSQNTLNARPTEEIDNLPNELEKMSSRTGIRRNSKNIKTIKEYKGH